MLYPIGTGATFWGFPHLSHNVGPTYTQFCYSMHDSDIGMYQYYPTTFFLSNQLKKFYYGGKSEYGLVLRFGFFSKT